MPAALLTPPAAERVANAVRAVLAGRDTAATAAEAGLEPADLADATDAYHLAGIAALERRAAAPWQQVNVYPAGHDPADRTLATFVGPRLDMLVAGGAASGWWHMNKPPGWRIRLLDADMDTVRQLLDDLAAAGVIAAWSPAIYEPETAAFGGDTGIGIAHALFCADSAGVLDHLRRGNALLGSRELSILLISAMCAAAGLDWYERGDIFARVAAMRPNPPTTANVRTALAAQLRVLLATPTQPESPLFTASGPAALAAPWRDAFEEAGRRLCVAATAGALSRGLRAVLAHMVIFHWNRFGFSASTQAVLARTAISACLPED
ncbi:thiopeptide-type bacteriocin biosynthesis protein [Pseudofrankia sp. BMG5.36]|uniref:thiopeptide-type bacteriocin biosynthesis protein n=1 Tax=Pseudofrankia sp. BMG5.36 TaxID=1834512 RepID=UPI0008D9E1A1|nr:thiopeptide-type bacteriocin biosynthesis protein [Pseudofrankia sp. BMG5.36]OHV64181.1 bacteriocin biosynthesis protein [Pseudofrankia sp. BMG5.36]